MKFTLVPEYRFEHFYDITAEFLLSIGIKGVLLDIDNTLEPYENPTPGKHVTKWLSELNNVGINAAIVSNNDWDRVEEFNKNIGMPAFAKAGKPFKKNLIKAMGEINVDKNHTVFIGDQILTDVWAAHNAGIRAILVPPINDRKDLLTRFKRILEKPIINKYEKLRKKGNR